ncbi:MFS transporter [Paenibacillus yanchengensis]|uniref:MFS transporter n=1 Tax=Paenibacillus yanchengensis TaxID=2035833 RepID=A0ABW4YFZ5_9BACL
MGVIIRLKERLTPVTMVAIVTAISLLGDSMLYIVLPVYWRQIGLDSLWQVGILLSINRFVRLPLNPILGWLYHKMSLRTGLLVAIVLGTLTTIGYGVFKGFIIWLILRIIWGIAWSLLRIGGYFAVINYSDDTNRGYVMGKFNGVSRLGSLVGMLAGGILVPIIGLPTVAIVFGCICAIGIPIIMLFVSKQTTNETSVSPSFKQVSVYLKSAPVLKIIIGGLLISLLYATMSATLSLVIETHYASDISVFGIILGSTALAGAIQAARWLWEPFLAVWIGRMSDGPKGRTPLLFASLMIAAICFALIPWSLPIYIWILIVLFALVTGTAVTTLMDAVASDIGKSSMVIAIMTAYSVATDLGAALGPMISFWVLEATGGIVPVYSISAILFVVTALWLRTLKEMRPTFQKTTSESVESV